MAVIQVNMPIETEPKYVSLAYLSYMTSVYNKEMF